MEELIINCKTGKETRRKFTPTEIHNRLAEIAKAEEEEAIRFDQQTKQALADASIQLGMMQELEKEGTVTAADVEPYQKRVDELKKQLKPIEPLET